MKTDLRAKRWAAKYPDLGTAPLPTETYRVEERANWKVVLDAQNELYHLPHQHRWTLGDVFAKDELSGSRFRDFTLYGHHNSWSAEYGPRECPCRGCLAGEVSHRAAGR